MFWYYMIFFISDFFSMLHRLSGVEVFDCTPDVLYEKVSCLKIYLLFITAFHLQIVSVEEDSLAVETRVSG